jgi:hypothetical protein
MKQVERQKNALKRLKEQLTSGVKTCKGTVNTKLTLNDEDKKRINKEIEILEQKIK